MLDWEEVKKKWIKEFKDKFKDIYSRNPGAFENVEKYIPTPRKKKAKRKKWTWKQGEKNGKI